MSLQRKAVPVAGFKVVQEDRGIVEAIVSVTGVVDEVKDNILPGAYAKTLKARTPKGAWSHQWDQPVSKTLAAEELMPGDSRLPAKQRNGDGWPAEAGGLLIRMQYNLKTQRGLEAYEDAKFFGEDSEWSIGYSVPVGGAKVNSKTSVREIREIELFEYSQVLFGAMPLASTVGIKAAQEGFREAREAAGITPHQFRGEGDTCEACGQPDGTKGHVVETQEEPLLEGDEGDEGDDDGAHEKGGEPTESVETKKAIASHSTGTDDGAWDGPAQEKRLKGQKAALRKAHAWVDPDGDDDAKASYRFIHHFVDAGGDPGDASTKACSTGIGVLNGGRGGTTIPAGDRKGVHAHLAKHLTDAGMEPPDLKDEDDGKAAVEGLARKAFEEFASALVDALRERGANGLSEDEAKRLATQKLAEVVEGKAFVRLTGSYEERQEALGRAVRRWARADDNPFTDGMESRYRYYAYVEATFDDRCVWTLIDWRTEDAERYFEAPYTFADGAAELGDVREVVVEATVAAKSAGARAGDQSASSAARAVALGLDEKAGRVLSRRNSSSVRAAIEALRGVLDAAGEEHDYGTSKPKKAGGEGGDEAGVQEPEQTQDAERQEQKGAKVRLTADELEQAKALLLT